VGLGGSRVHADFWYAISSSSCGVGDPTSVKRAIYIQNVLSGNYLHQAGTKNGAQGTPIGIVRPRGSSLHYIRLDATDRLSPFQHDPKCLFPRNPVFVCQPNLHLFRMSSQIPGPSKSGKARKHPLNSRCDSLSVSFSATKFDSPRCPSGVKSHVFPPFFYRCNPALSTDPKPRGAILSPRLSFTFLTHLS
jgi:hypothetical protein